MFKVDGRWLIMRLPSGRKIWYCRPESKDGTVFYYGINTITRQWGITSTYGGKLCENETQAGCRDLLVNAKFRLTDAGYDLIGSIHDEPAMEVDEQFGSEDEVRRLMCHEEEWHKGLPLAIDYHRAKRFSKAA